jgi:hypothetical protein
VLHPERHSLDDLMRLKKALVAKALGGDTRAATVVFGMAERIERAATEAGVPAAELAPEDQAVLDSFKQRWLSEQSAEVEGGAQ